MAYIFKMGRSIARVYLLVIFINAFLHANAQNGWLQIRNNNNRAARTEFIKQLEKDSIDQNALKGMIYLSEIEQDKISYKKYINLLLNHHYEEHTFLLFQDAYMGDINKPLKQISAFTSVHINAEIQKAEELKRNRKFEEASKAYSELFTNFDWNLIGPFKNLCGSGFTTKHPIEKEPFDPTKSYLNQNKLELNWVKPRFTEGNGKVSFNNALPSTFGSAVFYANSFIEVSEETIIQMRIGRSAPMKIWLDDDLIFNSDRKIHFGYDNEIVELKIKPGTHRILVKLASAPAPAKSYDFLTFMDGRSNFENNYLDNYDYTGIFGAFNDDDQRSYTFRITDTNGNNLKKIKPTHSTNYTPGKYIAKLSEQPVVEYFYDQAKLDPSNLFNYYALHKAVLDAGLNKDWEEYFVKTLRKDPQNVMLKYINAKLYAENGKVEKAYEVLNDINNENNPIFASVYEKFKDIDLNTDEQRYIEFLEKLKTITPGNYSVINAYINYYDKKGMQKEKKAFVEDMIKKYPTYKFSLESELENDNKPYKDRTDKEKESNIKESIKNIRSHFNVYDYKNAISYYKGKDKFNKVIDLYDELIKYEPFEISHRKEKARYLYSESKFDLALKELDESTTLAPYDDDILELIGDVYSDKEKDNESNKKKALEFYYKAKKYNSYTDGLQNKIDKIEGQRSLKKIFITKSFDDFVNDEGWKLKYSNDESVILMFTRDLVYDSNANVDVYQQIMIKILTEQGAKEWLEYDFSFMGNINLLKVVKANGAELIPDHRGGRVVFKNLEPGDIIEIDGVYKWLQKSELDLELSLIHYVSFEAPVYYKKFEVAVPKNTYLGYLYHKLDDKLEKYSKGNYDFYKWEYAYIPKVENEDAVPDKFDLYSSIMISTLPDWSKVVEWYQNTTYKKLELTYEVKEALDSIIKPSMTPNEKVETIYNYLTKEIKYSYVPFLQSGYVPKEPGLTLSARIGDCKDVATLMIVMLKAVGIDAWYTLVKTNSFNHQDVLPSLYFDHVIVKYIANGKEGYLDMTTDFYPHYVLTENDVNAVALLVKEGEKNVFRLPNYDLDSSKSMITFKIDVDLNTDRTINLNVAGIYRGISGGNFREIYSSISQTEQRNFLVSKLGKGVFQNLELTNYTIDNLKEISDPLRINYTLKVPEFSDAVANLLICRIPYITTINPSSIVSSKERHNRILLDELTDAEPVKQIINLKIPKDYHLVETPKNIAVQSKYGSYRVNFNSSKPGVLQIEKYQDFKVPIVDNVQFNEFKDFYARLLDYDKLKIAIQRNN